MTTQSISKEWRLFLIETLFVRNYRIASNLDGSGAVQNPILEKFLPSLLHIKMTAILDEALENKIAQSGTLIPKKYRRNLHGWISFASDESMIKNGDKLHEIRLRRNETAHEIKSIVTWDQLDIDALEIEGTLKHLNLIETRPKFEIKGERSAMQGSDDPDIAFYCDYSVKVTEGEKVAAEWKWRKLIHNDKSA